MSRKAANAWPWRAWPDFPAVQGLRGRKGFTTSLGSNSPGLRACNWQWVSSYCFCSIFDLFFGQKLKQLKGRNYSSANLILKIIPAQTEKSRVGFVVSNKIDKRATARNKIKRQIREVVKKEFKKFKKKSDLLIIAKAGIKNKEFEGIEKEVLSLLKKARLL